MTEEQILIRIKAIAEMGDARMAQAEIKKLAQASEAAGAAGTKAAGGQKNMGLAALEASRAFEDMQYGIRGILNNIPQLVMYLGAGSGVAAAASLAAVSLSVLLPKLGLLGAESEESKKHAKDAAEALDKLTEKAKAAKEELSKEMGEEWTHQVQRQIDAIHLHSQALTENISYMKARAAAEKSMVDAQAALAMVQVDARAKTDPNYSEVQQLRDKAAIEEASRRRLSEIQLQELEAKRQEAQNKVTSAREELEQTQRNIESLRVQEADALRRIDEAKEQIQRQAALEAEAKLIEEKLQINDRSGRGAMIGLAGSGRGEYEAAQKRMRDAQTEAALINAPAKQEEISFLEAEKKRFAETIKKAEETLQSQSNALVSAMQAMGAISNEIDLTQQNVQQVLDVKTRTESLKTTTAVFGATVGSLVRTADALEAEVKAATEAGGGTNGVLTRTHAEIKAQAQSIRAAVSDGVITKDEMQKIFDALAKAQANQSTMSRQTIQLLERTRAEMEALKSRLNALETRPTN